ncbi:hypothetical protein ACLB2K_072144 [Fragaria x ananassa]
MEFTRARQGSAGLGRGLGKVRQGAHQGSAGLDRARQGSPGGSAGLGRGLGRARQGARLFLGLIIPTDSLNRFTPLLVVYVIDASGNWNITHLEPFLNGDDAKSIKSILIGSENDRDVLIWPFSKSDVYSAKSGYRRIVKEQGGKGSSKPSSSHMIDAKTLCVLFVVSIRKLQSIACFYALGLALYAWFGSSLGYIPEKASITSLDAWLLAVYSNSSKLSHHNEEFFQFVCFHLWEIWKQRCVAVMKRVSPNPVTTIENIHENFKEWSEAQSDYDPPPDEPRRSIASKLWHPPSPNVAEADSVVKGLQIARVKFLLPAFDEVLWNWVPREANRVADAVAKLAMVRLCSSDWANTPPTSLLHILRSDGHPD